jgi:hypothetical protein
MAASSQLAELLLAEWVDHRHFEDWLCHFNLFSIEQWLQKKEKIS